MHIETKCLHEGYKPENGGPGVMPIVQSTTYRIWHLTHGFAQVAGFHRAVPSTALDKEIYSFTRSILYKNTRFVKAYFRQPPAFTVD